jgi:hypothetical protein
MAARFPTVCCSLPWSPTRSLICCWLILYTFDNVRQTSNASDTLGDTLINTDHVVQTTTAREFEGFK